MLYSLRDTVANVGPYLPAALVGRDAFERIGALATGLPDAMGSWGFECRLGAGQEQVDFGGCVTPEDGRAILAGLDGSAPDDPWRALARLSVHWGEDPVLRDRLECLFLEFDVPTDAAPSAPSVFLRLRSPLAHDRRAERIEIVEAAECAIASALSGPDGDESIRRLRRILEVLSDDVAIPAVGLMLGRSRRPVRVNAWVPRWRLRETLRGLGWPEMEPAVSALVTELDDSRRTHVELACDMIETATARLGIEFSIDDHGDPFRATLDRLAGHGFCSPEKRDALLRWPGRAAVMLPGVEWPCTIVREVSHLKCVIEPGSPVVAKGYLVATPTFRLFR